MAPSDLYYVLKRIHFNKYIFTIRYIKLLMANLEQEPVKGYMYVAV